MSRGKPRQESDRKEGRKKSSNDSKNFIDSKLEKKLEGYFLFIALSRKCFHPPKAHKSEKYQVFVGKGNNAKLIRQIFGWRHWWTVTHNPNAENLNIIW